jgi:hypothetical protein
MQVERGIQFCSYGRLAIQNNWPLSNAKSTKEKSKSLSIPLISHRFTKYIILQSSHCPKLYFCTLIQNGWLQSRQTEQMDHWNFMSFVADYGQHALQHKIWRERKYSTSQIDLEERACAIQVVWLWQVHVQARHLSFEAKPDLLHWGLYQTMYATSLIHRSSLKHAKNFCLKNERLAWTWDRGYQRVQPPHGIRCQVYICIH